MQRLEGVLEGFHAEVDLALDFGEDCDFGFLVEGDGGAGGGGGGGGPAGYLGRGWGVVFGAGAEEAVEAAGGEDVPFLVGDGGEGGEDVVQGGVGEEVDCGFGGAGSRAEAVEALDGEGGGGEEGGWGGVGGGLGDGGGGGAGAGRGDADEGGEGGALVGFEAGEHGEGEGFVVDVLGSGDGVGGLGFEPAVYGLFCFLRLVDVVLLVLLRHVDVQLLAGNLGGGDSETDLSRVEYENWPGWQLTSTRHVFEDLAPTHTFTAIVIWLWY